MDPKFSWHWSVWMFSWCLIPFSGDILSNWNLVLHLSSPISLILFPVMHDSKTFSTLFLITFSFPQSVWAKITMQLVPRSLGHRQMARLLIAIRCSSWLFDSKWLRFLFPWCRRKAKISSFLQGGKLFPYSVLAGRQRQNGCFPSKW